ncbi:MAG: carboxypeptidase regulatory-like domain-containing protein [Bacteroidia bacterium]
MTKTAALICLLLTISNLFAQGYTQTVKGVVSDKNLMNKVAGVLVIINSDSNYSAVTDVNGRFEIKNVEVGRVMVTAKHSLYSDVVIPNLLLTSGKELVVNIQMEEKITQIKGFKVKSKSNKFKAINDMSIVSARSFSVEETQNYAAAINDPARMATSFAGVVGADDGNNSIVIRGNSPSALLWRMEGIDIPAPNHFASFNGSGGGVSILSSQLLGNSDFMTGAFASEYGNALGGVFDLKLRKGNDKKREYTLQAGFLGLDLAVEGPLSKKGGSFLVNYRYSTLGVIQKLGIDIDGLLIFQDLSYNIVLPESKLGTISFFGFGGLSSQIQKAEKDSSKWEFKSDRYNFFYGSNTGAAGMSHMMNLSKKTTWRNVILYSANIISDKGDFYKDNYNQTFTHWKNSIGNSKLAINSTVNHKINKNLYLRSGLIVNKWHYQTKQKELDSNDALHTFLDNEGNTFYLQGFAQIKARVNRKLSLYGGFHSMYLNLNKTYSIEPRFSAKYSLNRKSILSLGYGLHSQLQLPGVYFTQVTNSQGDIEYPNRSIGFNKAHHIVAGYEYVLKNQTRLKVETYYQHLFNIPVSADNKNYSILNSSDGIISQPLVNNGLGKNYGLEITVERSLNKGFYYMMSASIYNSLYRANNKKWYNTAYNGNHTLVLSAGKEIKLKGDKKLFGMNIKTTWYGGFRETPIDIEQSRQYQQTIRQDSKPFSTQLPAYFRTDVRFSYRINHARFNSIWSLDIQNASNRKNIGGTYFDIDKEKQSTWYQTPLIPILSYKIEF